MKDFFIADRLIAPGLPCYIIAELSANHGHDYEKAVKLVYAAKEAGADAIKLQTYRPETMTLNLDYPWFKIQGTLWDQQSLYALYEKAFTPWEWHEPLQRLCEQLDLDFFSSPFDASAVSFLEKLNIPVYKIASFEMIDFPLIQKAANTQKPLIISTGMATLEEMDETVQYVQNLGAPVALLKCNSSYPSPPQEMHLRDIQFLAQRFKVPIGLSDHTMGFTAAIAAVTLGACIIEKHITLSRQDNTADAEFSTEPDEFKQMVDAIREVEKTLIPRDQPGPTQNELASRALRRSLFYIQDVDSESVLNESHFKALRPANGLAPKFATEIIGKKLNKSVKKGHPVQWDDFA